MLLCDTSYRNTLPVPEVSFEAKPSAFSPPESMLSCDSELTMRLLEGHWLAGVSEAAREICRPESRLKAVTTRSMVLLLPPTKIPLSPACWTVRPYTCQ